jgi:hypothetical protein
MRRGEGCPLVGDRDVAANEALLAQASEKGDLVAGRDSAARIAASNRVLLEPMAMDDG